MAVASGPAGPRLRLRDAMRDSMCARHRLAGDQPSLIRRRRQADHARNYFMPPLSYSALNASIGSVRVARHAGITHAAAAVITSNSAVPMNTRGSCGDTSYNVD